ncbi:MAG: glycosyltransferase, partial [Candidatus Levyibacteriota bacterium]
WNTLHIFPIEWFIGPVDVFISSDWTQPPSRAKKATILYDLIVYKYPKETAEKIIAVQKRRLHWVKKEVDNIFCISNATKKDAREVLGIPEEKLEVIYPGL